jgi:hypothetical protein
MILDNAIKALDDGLRRFNEISLMADDLDDPGDLHYSAQLLAAYSHLVYQIGIYNTKVTLCGGECVSNAIHYKELVTQDENIIAIVDMHPPERS